MKVFWRRLALGVVLCAIAPGGRAADDPVRILNEQATAAHRAKDYAAFLKHSQALADLVPWSVRARYNLACAHALIGEPAVAMRILEGLAAQQIAFDLPADDDLASLREREDFAEVQRRMDALATPVGQARPAFSLDQKDLIPEGVAHDPKTGAFFVSSVRHRKIVRVAPDGKASDFVGEGQDGLQAALALAVDPPRRALWVSSRAMEQMAGLRKGEAEGRAFLAEYDLDTGRQRRTVVAPEGGVVADVTAGSDGTIYAADPENGRVYVLAPAAKDFRTLVEKGSLRSAQGIAIAPDGQTLYVADYARGVARVRVADGSVSWLSGPPDTALTGIDGLVLADGWLVAIQNGLTPHRVIGLRLDDAGQAITEARLLERGHRAFDEPTLGVVVGPDFYFVANSQYGHFRRDGSLDETRLVGAVVLRTPLPR
jgi:sugar lactone lactonase YvrE